MFIKTTAAAEAEDQTPENAETTLGSFLKSARESQGLDLSTIAQETKINGKNLLALEENNLAGLPADVFSRGFVKLYAAYLKLDVQQALRLYEKQWGAKGKLADPLAPPKSSPSLAWPGLIMSLLLIALFIGVRLYSPDHTDDFGKESDSGSRFVPSNQDQAGNEISPAPSSPSFADNQAAVANPTVIPEIKPAEAAKPAAKEEPTTAPTTESTSVNPETPLPPYEIRLQSVKKTKIKLALDGQGSIEKNLRPGSSQTWQATKSFDLTVDSTAGIALTVNGTTIPITAEAGQTVTIHRP